MKVFGSFKQKNHNKWWLNVGYRLTDLFCFVSLFSFQNLTEELAKYIDFHYLMVQFNQSFNLHLSLHHASNHELLSSERGIAVGNTPGVLSDCTADMAFALLMASARNIVEGDKISKSPETKQVSFNFDKGNDQ